MFIGKGGKGLSGFYDIFYILFLSSLQNHYNIWSLGIIIYYVLTIVVKIFYY